jgi:hypothetical protein
MKRKRKKEKGLLILNKAYKAFLVYNPSFFLP